MPFVPAGLPAAAYRDTLFGSTLRKNVTTGAETLTPKSYTGQFRLAVKSGAVGKKVKHSFGWWSPVRPYTRSAIAVRVTGNEQVISPIPDWWGHISTVSGYPQNMPTLPTNFSFYKLGVVDVSGVPTGPSTNTRNRLITECILKIEDRKISIAESLAEVGKTIDHLAKTSISVVRALLALRRGNFRAAARALGLGGHRIKSGKSSADQWLSWQYAWLPLLSDIFNSWEIAKNGLGIKPPVISATRNLGDTFPWSPVGNQGFADLEGTLRLNHRCKLWYRLDDAVLHRLSQLGLINPLEVAWALIPFSFIIDWFMPVQNVLAACTATMGLTYVDGVITSHAEGKASGESKFTGSSSQYMSSNDFMFRVDQKGIRRIRLPSASPFLYFKSPFSTTHVLSAIALIRKLRK